MASQKKNSAVTLEEVKKSIDRLAIIELVKSGAKREQIREVMGSLDNDQLSKIKKAISAGQNIVED
jgi:uncharacterized protein YerC